MVWSRNESRSSDTGRQGPGNRDRGHDQEGERRRWVKANRERSSERRVCPVLQRGLEAKVRAKAAGWPTWSCFPSVGSGVGFQGEEAAWGSGKNRHFGSLVASAIK